MVFYCLNEQHYDNRWKVLKEISLNVDQTHFSQCIRNSNVHKLIVLLLFYLNEKTIDQIEVNEHFFVKK